MSDWEDDPIQTRPGGEASNGHTSKYKAPVHNGAEDDDGGWGGDDGALTWAQEDGGVQLQSNRFNDRDDNLWGGGGAGVAVRQMIAMSRWCQVADLLLCQLSTPGCS